MSSQICIALSLILIFSIPVLADDGPPDIRRAYNSGHPAPLFLLYKDYLGYVHRRVAADKMEDAVDLVIFTLDLDQSEASRTLARYTIEQFERSYRAMKLEIASSSIENYCSSEERSNDDAFAAMDQQDDENLVIVERHYNEILESLDSSFVQKLIPYLERRKGSFSYVALDHKRAWEKADPEADANEILHVACEEQRQSKSELLGEGKNDS